MSQTFDIEFSLGRIAPLKQRSAGPAKIVRLKTSVAWHASLSEHKIGGRHGDRLYSALTRAS